MRTPIVAVFLAIVLCSCGTPYTASIKQLDEAHRLGYIQDPSYTQERLKLMEQDTQWRREANARVFAGASASIAQTNAQYRADQAQQAAAFRDSVARMNPPAPSQRHYHTVAYPPDYPGGPQRVETAEDSN